MREKEKISPKSGTQSCHAVGVPRYDLYKDGKTRVPSWLPKEKKDEGHARWMNRRRSRCCRY